MKRTIDSEGDEDFADDADAGVLWCPHCGSEMYGDATRCPKCGDYVSPVHHPAPGSMPWWMWAIVILVGFALLAGLFASFR